MSNYKDNESGNTFVQKDVFRELELASNAVHDIYKFKEDFRVKTTYENYNALYRFGSGFKYVLSFITASLAGIGFFFLFYFDNFQGFFNYLILGLAMLFGLAMSVALEKARYTIAPIVAKSFLRDKKLQKGLLIAAIAIQVASIGSTIYGTYKAIELFYTPTLADESEAGQGDGKLIAEYEAKIKDAKTEKEGIEDRRTKYENSSGKNGSWIQDEDYRRLTKQISDFEQEIINLRVNIREDKKTLRSDNKAVLAQHSENKYLFVWVAAIISLISEILLSIILFLLERYKYATLKQLDTIQNPIQTVLQLVENPLTELKSHLIGNSQSVALPVANVATNIAKKDIGFNVSRNASNSEKQEVSNTKPTGSTGNTITMASASKFYHEYHKRLKEKYTDTRQARVNYFAWHIQQMALKKIDRMQQAEFELESYLNL